LARESDLNGHSKWIVVGLLFLVAALNYADWMAIFSVFPLLKKEMGVSDLVLSMLGSSFLWVYGASSPLGGFIGDRFNRKQAIIWSLAIFSVVTFASGFAQTGLQFILFRVLLGFSEAIFLPTALAHIATFHSDSTRSLANAIALAGFPVGAGIGGFYGGYMGDHYSWRAGFYVLGIVGLVVALILVVFLPGHPPSSDLPPHQAKVLTHEPPLRKIAAIMSTPTAVCVIILAFGLSMNSWPTGTWMPTYLHDRFGMSLTRSGLIMALFIYVPCVIGEALGGWWADRWARRDCRGRIGVQIVALAVMAPTMLAMGLMPTGTAVTANLLVYSLARGLLEVNSMPIFSTVVARQRWSTAYGIYNLAGTLAGSLGVLFVGSMKASWGIGYGLSATSLFLFISIGVMVMARRYLAHDIKNLAADPLAAIAGDPCYTPGT